MNAHQKIIKDNARTILKIITKYYGCKYSAALYVILKEHPDFPSFLSFQYILHRMGKDSFAIHTSYEELTNIPSPFIAHVITNVDLFLFITKVTAESIQTIDEKGKIESISRKDFEDMWDGNILIMDNRPGKISIPLKMKFSTIIKQIKYPMLILCVAILFAYLLILKHEGGILFYLYLTGVLGGLTASILLFVDQIDKYNVHIKKLCSATGNKNNIDCSSILDFKDAYFLGLVSWSDIGFVYFLSLLIVLLFLPFGTAQALINLDCLQYRICMLFSFLSEIHSKKMVYPLPFCTSGIRFSVYAKYMYFKDELYIRIATFEINNRNNDDLRYCYIYLYSHQADNCHSKRTHHLEKKIQRINI